MQKLGLDRNTAKIKKINAGDYQVSIHVSGHELIGDEPIDSGGNNVGPAPYDLLLAALGTCTVMTIQWYAKQKNLSIDHIEVLLRHQKQDAKSIPDSPIQSGKIDVFEKEVIIKAAQLTSEQIEKLYEIAEKCPVQKTLSQASIFKKVKLS